MHDGREDEMSLSTTHSNAASSFSYAFVGCSMAAASESKIAVDALVSAAHKDSADAVARVIIALPSVSADDRTSIINASDSGGRTALHYAALHNDRNLIAVLYHHDADPNVRDGQGQTPLHLALMKKSGQTSSKSAGSNIAAADTLLTLYQQRINVFIADDFGRLPLHWAAQQGLTHILLRLTDSTHVNARTLSGDTPLHWAITENRSAETVSFLCDHNADLYALNSRQETPYALAQEASPLLKSIVDKFAAKQKSDETALAATTSESMVTPVRVAVSTSVNVRERADDTNPAPKKKKMTITLKKK